MEENKIFGSNVALPSLPGLQSDCEEEILFLMNEVDEVFQTKHGELLNELKHVRSLCRAQRDEIEKLRWLTNPNCEKEIHRWPESEQEFDSLKRSLCTQQDENKRLKDRLININQQYQTLHNSYQRLINTLAAHRGLNIDEPTENKVGESSSANFIEAQAVQTTEKFMSEETEFCNEFEFKISQDINDLERRFSKQMI